MWNDDSILYSTVAGGRREAVRGRAGRDGLGACGTLEERGVVADFAELHEDVHHAEEAARGQDLARVVARNEVLVQPALPLRKWHAHDHFLFRRQLFLHILLQAPQDERAQHRMQLREQLSVHRVLALRHSLQRVREPVLWTSALNKERRKAEAGSSDLELLHRTEDIRHQEVQQRPELDLSMQKPKLEVSNRANTAEASVPGCSAAVCPSVAAGAVCGN
jgi:hypothetical protein